jgi:hypothetical protein
MMLRSRFTTTIFALALYAAIAAPLTAAQPKPAPATAAVPTPEELAGVREQLVSLVRMTPTLEHAVEVDPSLLADQDYVSRTNPQLAQFLTQHPEVARNPDFYLFAEMDRQGDRYTPPLRRAGAPRDLGSAELHREYIQDFLGVFAFLGGTGALLWLIRILLENRRWSRVFRQQTEIHSKLIDRFATNQELLEYMSTEAGRRFLEASPIPIDPDRSHALPGGVARILGPVQFGIVFSLLGFGLLLFHPLFMVGVIAMMLGLGFILSAIVSWRISARLGLLPNQETPPAAENRQ